MNTNTLLSNSYAKLERASELLQELETKFLQYLDSQPFEIKQETDVGTLEFILVFYPRMPIPDNCLTVIGDVLFNLRSALDQAIYELTVLESGGAFSNTEFPIFQDSLQFYATEKNGKPARKSGLYKIRGLHPKVRERIEALQPFHHNTAGHVSVLSLLHELNIKDKHRELHLCCALAESTKVIIVRDVTDLVHWNTALGGTLDQPTIISRLKRASGLDENVYLDAEVALEIAFQQSASISFKRPEVVIPILQRLIRGVGIVLGQLKDAVSP